MKSDAEIDGQYRYRLTREWEPEAPSCCFVMLNPSTADGREDDPTIRKCIGFARGMGFGSIEVVNLFAFRATNPVDLRDSHEAGIDIVGGIRQDAALLYALTHADRIVVAWGGHGDRWPDRVKTVRQMICGSMALKYNTYCLGFTKSGQPAHPLMLSYMRRWWRWPEDVPTAPSNRLERGRFIGAKRSLDR